MAIRLANVNCMSPKNSPLLEIGLTTLRMPFQCSAVEFSWSRDQLAFRGLVIQFARTKINSGALDRDRIGQFPDEAWKECAAFGIFGLTMPEQYNGTGRDMVAIGLATESLGFDCEA